MKRLDLLVFGALLASTLCHANSKPAPSKEKFNTAYKKYQECVASKDLECTATQAQIAYEEAIKIIPEDSKNAAALLYNYGLAVSKLTKNKSSHHSKAYGLLQQALPLNIKYFGRESPQVLSLLIDLHNTQIYEKTSERRKNRYWHQAVEISEKLYGESSIDHAMTLMEVSAVMVSNGGYVTSWTKKYLDDAYDIFQKEAGATHPYTGFVAFNLGKYKMTRGKNRSATDYFEKALTAFEVDEGYRNRYSLTTHGFLVQAYEAIGESEHATEHCLAIGKSQPAVPTDKYYPLFKQPPIYPESAARSKQEGFVIYEYTVTEQGFTKDHKLIEWGGSKSFIEPSLEAAKKFRYAPQFMDGEAVAVEGVRNRFSFIMGK